MRSKFLGAIEPALKALARGAELRLTFGRIVGALLVIGIFIVAGGVVALLVGDAMRPKQAIAYGLGWQGLIGGFLQGQRAGAPEPKPAPA